MDGGLAITAIDVAARELALFACVGLLIGGVDDLLIDLLWLSARRKPRPATICTAKRFAVFVPAWDEADVIGAMLKNTLARFAYDQYRLYVGIYLNDRATVAAVTELAARDRRIRLVINPRAGPTTKGDNLNAMWRALVRDEVADGWIADAVVLHDAEDVVDAAELGVFAGALTDYAVVQLPVVPLIAANSRWVSGHYADEFAIAHDRTLTVRQRLGAGLPLAGVGCAIRRDALARIAAARPSGPFDASSLTEDYELGLKIAELGGRAAFVRMTDDKDRLICVHSYFPTTVETAVRQKSRWIAGIALLGWDRLGWGRSRNPSEYWMRMRDRRGPIAMMVLVAAYLAMGLGALSAGLHLVNTTVPPTPLPVIVILLTANSALLLWRLVARGLATGRAYGWREGARALPRTVVGNFIGLLAVHRAFSIYLRVLRGGTPVWDKTAHIFPTGARL